MEEEKLRFHDDMTSRNAQLTERQLREIQDFDLYTTTMDMDAMAIVEQTQNFEDDDLDSVRGSTLSLTPSQSTNSFTRGGAVGHPPELPPRTRQSSAL